MADLPEKFVLIEDMAKYFLVSVSTVRGWLRQGHIPKSTYIKIGNTYRFNLPAVVAALTAKDDDEVEAKDTAIVVPEEKEPVQLELDLNIDEDG